MSDTHTIRKIYDIASAFITDRSALIQSHGTTDGVIYTFTIDYTNDGEKILLSGYDIAGK